MSCLNAMLSAVVEKVHFTCFSLNVQWHWVLSVDTDVLLVFSEGYLNAISAFQCFMNVVIPVIVVMANNSICLLASIVFKFKSRFKLDTIR